jgi:hypothetical protein
MFAGFYWLSSLTVWQRQWWLSLAVIAVIVNGSGGGIEPTAPMVALLMVRVVDGGSDNGVFTTTSHDNNRHPCPHHPCPCPPLDEDWTAHHKPKIGWY